MAPPKRARAPKTADAPATPSALMVKGLTAADFAALDSITEKRRAALEAVGEGGTTSRNAVVVAALRAFIRRELPDGDRRF